MSDPISIVHLPEAQRFETTVDGHVAHVSYQQQPGVLAYTHTLVPEALGGRGIGSALVRHVLDYALAQNLKVDPQCSFIKSYIDRHPAYQPISLAHGAAR